MNKTAKAKITYQAYTLLEVLVVMAIIIILTAGTYVSFRGLRNTVAVNQSMLTLEQIVRNTQRSAMLLERGDDERWLYGIGVDFSDIENGNYKVFKWCSPYNEYGNSLTRSKLPAYNPEESIPIPPSPVNETSNATLPVVSKYENSSCSQSGVDESSELIEVTGTSKEDLQIDETVDITIEGTEGIIPVYVLFESVSGRAFLYDSSGRLLNVNTDGEPLNIEDRIDLKILLGGNADHVVKIGYLSGKITTYINE